MDRQARNWDHCLEQASLSDVGLRRANNQDSMVVVLAGSQEQFESRGHLFVVADGMGAHAAGELASKMATDIVPLTYHKLTDRPAPQALLEAIHQANRLIHGRGEADHEFRGMGTTLEAMALLPQGVLVAHIGDSRVYRLRQGYLEQLTFDHSLVWEMRAAGHLSDNEDEVPSFVPRNVITRSMGPNPDVQVDLEGPFPMQVGDTFLLCSDGLSGQVEDKEIGQVLTSLEPNEAAQALVNLANLRGGPDNITVVIARVTGPQRINGAANDAVPAPSLAGRPRTVPSAIWVLLGVLTLAAILLPAMGSLFGALACLAVAALGGLGALLYRYSRLDVLSFDPHPLGKGPYRHVACQPNGVLAGQLDHLVAQLQEVAQSEGWDVDWTHFGQHRRQAANAAGTGDSKQAIGEYCRAITFMMEQLKRQRAAGREADRAAGLF